MKQTLLSLSLAALATVASAEEEEKKLSKDIELGFVATSGNTESNSLNGKLDLKQELESFRNHFVLSGLHKEDQVTVEVDDEEIITNQTTAERYFTSFQTDYKLNKKSRGLFLFGSYEEDKFSGFEYQGILALGYSDRLFKYDNSHLKYSIGPGVSILRTEEELDDDGNVETESEKAEAAVVRISLDYLYKISEHAKFTQLISADVAVSQDENTKANSQTAISANIANGLALKASYTINHNTEVSDDTEKTDTITSITFVLSF